MIPDLNGGYAYTIQGYMHGQNLDNQKYIAAGNRMLQVGQGGYGNYPPRNVAEGPVIAAFYPSNYAPVYPPSPPPPGAPLNPPPQNPPPYMPNVGYYPYSETGYMIFSNGSVTGGLRVNTAGYPGGGSTFVGAYKFDASAHAPPNVPIRTGIITIEFGTQPQHVWDYCFVMVSDDELYLAANARLPRPGVATGTMKRIGK